MKIHVTADHIAHGTRTACQHCPVALAYTEATGHACMVDPSYMKDLMTQKIYELPAWLGVVIDHYDEAGEMEPFSFDL